MKLNLIDLFLYLRQVYLQLMKLVLLLELCLHLDLQSYHSIHLSLNLDLLYLEHCLLLTDCLLDLVLMLLNLYHLFYPLVLVLLVLVDLLSSQSVEILAYRHNRSLQDSYQSSLHLLQSFHSYDLFRIVASLCNRNLQLIVLTIDSMHNQSALVIHFP